MPSNTVPVGSAIGLHARPAALIAHAATELGVPVTLSTNGEEPVDAGSSLLIMTLGAHRGEPVEIVGEDAEAVDAIAELVQQDLDATSSD